MTWVPIFDATLPGFPSGTAKAKAAGVKAVAGYRGSTAWKKFTPTLRDQWRGAGFGIVAMFEADDPTRGYFRANGGRPNGVADGTAARADWRAIGYPDECLIAYSYDGNTGPGNYPTIKAYFQGVGSVDTCLPWAYIEPDVGEMLFADGLIGGIFAPAAYSWDPAGKASFDRPHVYWKQLHNGVTTLGGNVDMGEIRDDANIWWPAGHTGPIMGEDDMQLTDPVHFVQSPDVTYSKPTTTVEGVLASTNFYVLQTRNQLNHKLDQVIDLLGDSAKVEQAIQAAIVATGSSVDKTVLTAALVDALKQLASGDTPAVG